MPDGICTDEHGNRIEVRTSAGEARVRAMSTELLEINRPVCELAAKQWGQMSRGELDEKPDCPFCTLDNGCADCALSLYDKCERCTCGGSYRVWMIARDAEFTKGANVYVALRATPVMAAALEMASLLWRLLDVIENELAIRRSRKAEEAREAAATVEEPNVRKWLVREENGEYDVCMSATSPDRLPPGWVIIGKVGKINYWFSNGDIPIPKPDAAGLVCGVRLKPGEGPVDVTEWFTHSEAVDPAVTTWCGFEEGSLVYHKGGKGLCAVCNPKYVLSEDETLEDDIVCIRLKGEPTFQFGLAFVKDLVRVSCGTCEDSECYPSMDFPSCWSCAEPSPVSGIAPAPRVELPREVVIAKLAMARKLIDDVLADSNSATLERDK